MFEQFHLHLFYFSYVFQDVQPVSLTSIEKKARRKGQANCDNNDGCNENKSNNSNIAMDKYTPDIPANNQGIATASSEGKKIKVGK